MLRSAENILITGPPGVGKTTLIRSLCTELSDLRPEGFYTAEIREGGVRKGFELIDLAGDRLILSHVDIPGRFRVAKYGVDIAAFENYLDRHDFGRSASSLFVVDEIGKMECLSRKFITLIQTILQSDKCMIATIALKGGGPIADIKRRSDVRLVEITRRNRDTISSTILRHIGL